jgi:hypothetical protein
MAVSRVRFKHHERGYAAIAFRVTKIGDAVANAVARDAIDMAPIKTGNLVRTIRARRSMGYTWRVWVGTDYWMTQEFGVPYRGIIRPRLKKALWWSGLQHPIAIVTNHPGHRPQPFMRPALYQPRRIWVTPTGGIAVI